MTEPYGKLDGIDSRLNKIDIKLTQITDTFLNIEKLLHRHDKTLFGNDDFPGVVIEVDRLKEHRKNTEKTAFIVWSTAIALVGKILLDFLTK